MIHSMLQTKDYKEIEELTKVTSNYLRHLFQANQDFNRLADEIQHIRNYLEIQKIRYGDSIHFDLDWDPGLKDAAIPPSAFTNLCGKCHQTRLFFPRFLPHPAFHS